jgi:DNA repair photolyase
MSVTPLQALSTQPQDPAPRITIKETRCNTLLHKLAFGSSTGYTANFYKGCTHGCTYCYVPSLTHDERRWGTYVDVKVNAPAVLDKELMSLRKEEVFLSSASDPYQPVEARYRLTRRCLELLQKKEFPTSILTRSPLVLRDLDLLRKFRWVKVGMSVTTVPSRRFEPGVPSLRRRIETLRRLGEAGIKTWVSLAPVIPGMMLVDLEQLFEDLRGAGVSSVSFGILRFTGYEESRRMFEEAAHMTTAEALAGREEVVERLSGLVRRFGMERTTDEAWWRPDAEEAVSLDSFCDYPGSRGEATVKDPSS